VHLAAFFCLFLIVSAEAVAVNTQIESVRGLKMLEEEPQSENKVTTAPVTHSAVETSLAGVTSAEAGTPRSPRSPMSLVPSRFKASARDPTRDTLYIHARGTYLMYFYLAISMTILLLTFVFAGIIDTHTPSQFKAPAHSGVLQCRNWFECGFVPAVLFLTPVALGVVYAMKVRPAELAAREELGQTYKFMGPLAILMCSIPVITSAFLLLFGRGNRAVGFVFTFFLCLVFLFTISIQASIAFMVGEWKPFYRDGEIPHATVSDSMRYYGGAVSSLFAMSLTASLTPIAEFFVTEDDSQAFSYGRGVRMMFSALGACGMLLVSLVPLNGKEHKGASESWVKLHYGLAAAVFGTLYLYIVFVTVDSCSPTQGRQGNCNFVSYLGLALASLAVLGLGIAAILTMAVAALKENPLLRELFAASEYLLVAAMPLATIARFRQADFDSLTEALIHWNP